MTFVKSAFYRHLLAVFETGTDRLCSEFGLAFLKAKDVSNARARHGTFETSVIEVNAQDFGAFMDVLSST